MNKSVAKAIHYAAVLTGLGVVCAGSVAGLYAFFRPRIERLKQEAEQKALAQVLPTNVVTFAESGAGGRAVETVLVKEVENLRTETIDSANGKAFQPTREKDKLRAVYVVYGTPKAAAGEPAAAERLVGYAAKGRSRGYGGEIHVMVGVRADRSLTIYNAVVTQQNETPGLGANCQVKRTNKNMWQKLFGQTAGERVRAWTDQFGSAPFQADTPSETKGENLRGLSTEGKPSADLKVGKDGGKVDAISGATITSRAVCKAVAAAIEKIAAVTTWDADEKLRVLEAPTTRSQPATRPEGTPTTSPETP